MPRNCSRICVVLGLCASSPAIADVVIMSWPLDSDPGLTMTGEWSFGQPAGSVAIWSNEDAGIIMDAHWKTISHDISGIAAGHS